MGYSKLFLITLIITKKNSLFLFIKKKKQEQQHYKKEEKKKWKMNCLPRSYMVRIVFKITKVKLHFIYIYIFISIYLVVVVDPCFATIFISLVSFHSSILHASLSLSLLICFHKEIN